MRRFLKTVIIVFLALILVVGFSGVALAHGNVTIGKYKLTLGAENEPKVTGQRTFLEFWVEDTETGERVIGLDKTLTLEIEKDGVEMEMKVGTFFGEPDRYKASIYFTEPGTYVAHINGTIEETVVQDVHIEFEVDDVTQLMIPEVVDISAIAEDAETAIALAQDVDGRLGTVNTMAIVALILSIIATAGMVVSLVTRRAKFGGSL